MPLNFSSALFFSLHWIIYWKKKERAKIYISCQLSRSTPSPLWFDPHLQVTLIWNQGYCQLQQASFSTIPRRNKRLQTAHFNRNLRFSWRPINILHMEKQSFKVHHVACENIRFSSLFAAGDVSRGGTSTTQRQKFHTDDAKSVRNLVRSADWSTE